MAKARKLEIKYFKSCRCMRKSRWGGVRGPAGAPCKRSGASYAEEVQSSLSQAPLLLMQQLRDHETAEGSIAKASVLKHEVLQTMRMGGFRGIAGRARSFAADLPPCAPPFPVSVWNDLGRVAKPSPWERGTASGTSCLSSDMSQCRSMTPSSATMPW